MPSWLILIIIGVVLLILGVAVSVGSLAHLDRHRRPGRQPDPRRWSAGVARASSAARQRSASDAGCRRQPPIRSVTVGTAASSADKRLAPRGSSSREARCRPTAASDAVRPHPRPVRNPVRHERDVQGPQARVVGSPAADVVVGARDQDLLRRPPLGVEPPRRRLAAAHADLRRATPWPPVRAHRPTPRGRRACRPCRTSAPPTP